MRYFFNPQGGGDWGYEPWELVFSIAKRGKSQSGVLWGTHPFPPLYTNTEATAQVELPSTLYGVGAGSDFFDLKVPEATGLPPQEIYRDTLNEIVRCMFAGDKAKSPGYIFINGGMPTIKARQATGNATVNFVSGNLTAADGPERFHITVNKRVEAYADHLFVPSPNEPVKPFLIAFDTYEPEAFFLAIPYDKLSYPERWDSTAPVAMQVINKSVVNQSTGLEVATRHTVFGRYGSEEEMLRGAEGGYPPSLEKDFVFDDSNDPMVSLHPMIGVIRLIRSSSGWPIARLINFTLDPEQGYEKIDLISCSDRPWGVVPMNGTRMLDRFAPWITANYKAKKSIRWLHLSGLHSSDGERLHVENLRSDRGLWHDQTVSDISRGSQVETGIDKKYNEAAIKKDVAGTVHNYANNEAGNDRQADLDFVARVARVLRQHAPSELSERIEIRDTLNKELLQPFRIRVRSKDVGCKFKVAADGTFQLSGRNPNTGKSTSFPFVNGELWVGPWLGKYPEPADLELEPVHV